MNSIMDTQIIYSGGLMNITRNIEWSLFTTKLIKQKSTPVEEKND